MKKKKKSPKDWLEFCFISSHTHIHTHTPIITPHGLSFLFRRRSWHMGIRFHTFISGPGREADDISTLCPQMGAVTLFRAVMQLFQQHRGAWKASPWSGSHFQFYGKTPPGDVNQTAAINNGIETESVRAILESFSPDCLPLEGAFPLFSPFWDTCRIKRHIAHNRTNDICQGALLA